MATITLTDLTKHYNDGNIVAVDDVTATVEDGEFLVLVGPSGSGKSTILRMIAGLEDVTSGKIRINGTVVNDYKPRERDIAMVFQNYALYPNMSVRKNLEFGLKMSTSLSKDQRNSIIEDTADTVDITELLDKYPSQLSGGEKQRVALGRAIVRDPSVFLMDEPLSNLDAKLRRTMRTEIESLQADLGVTTVYVTHNQTEAMTMGDRIIVLNESEVQQFGTPLQCYFQPKNKFVAGFIGDPPMNFFDGTVQNGNFRCPAFEYQIRSDIHEVVQGHDAMTLGIRPEDIQLTDDRKDTQYVDCTVDVVEEMGSTQHVHLETIGSDQELIVIVDGTKPITEGEEYNAIIPQENIHLFDTQTGTSLHNCILKDNQEAKLSLDRQEAGVH
jgi:multiple sugar transport system ATP-binding protein